jgi:hypothetical protein
MIGSNIPHQDQTPFFIWSVLNAKEQGYDFLDMFFPPLTDSNMTPVVSEIEKLISDDMITNILKDSSSIHYKNAYALFELIINNGLGSLIFDMNELDALETNNNNWKSNDFLDSDMNEFDALETNNNNWKLNDFFDSEKMKKALAKAIYIYSIVFRSRTAKKMSRQIYAHTLAPNSEFKSTDYTTFWNNNEEVITITGITPFLINNSIIAVQDRQNEFIFLDRTPQSILENKYSYRYHASEGDPFHLFVKIQDMLFKLGATQTRLGFFRNVGIALWKAIKKQGIYDTLKKNWNASNKPKEHFYKSPENEKMSDYAKSEKETHISTQIEDKIKELASSKLYIINPLYAINSPNTKKYNNKNSLVLAIEMNATNTQKCLVESDIPDIKNKNLYVATALGEIITGTSSNRIVSIREILDSCPDPKKIVSTVDDKEETVLHRIIYNIVVMGLQEKDTKWKTKRIEENIEIIKLLAKHDIDINTTVIENPLYLAMRINDGCKLEIIETLLNSFPKLANAKDGQNETVLHKAIYNIAVTSVYEEDKEQKTKRIEENIEIIKLLVERVDISKINIKDLLSILDLTSSEIVAKIKKVILDNCRPEDKKTLLENTNFQEI